jgi:hypothetical protein
MVVSQLSWISQLKFPKAQAEGASHAAVNRDLIALTRTCPLAAQAGGRPGFGVELSS